MLPLALWNRRVIRANSVVLPAPFSPSNTVKSPRATVKVTLSSARLGPKA